MDTVYFHLMLSHVPVLGTVFALLLLGVASIRRSHELTRTALWGFAFAGLLAIPVYLTGEPAEESVEHLLGVSEAAIERHEDIAEAAFALVLTVGGIALAALVLFRARAVPQWCTLSLLTLAVVTSGVLAWTANLGGQIRHSEIRSGGSVTLTKSDSTAIRPNVPKPF